MVLIVTRRRRSEKILFIDKFYGAQYTLNLVSHKDTRQKGARRFKSASLLVGGGVRPDQLKSTYLRKTNKTIAQSMTPEQMYDQ